MFQQLKVWAGQKGGMVCGPDTGFHCPDGSRRSPDAAWFDEARWREARQRDRRRRFPVFAPEFVIEIRSLGDRLRPLQEKMEEYIANGVRLGWLIDPKERSVSIYSIGAPLRVLHNPSLIEGEGPMAGFILNLRPNSESGRLTGSANRAAIVASAEHQLRLHPISDCLLVGPVSHSDRTPRLRSSACRPGRYKRKV